MPCTDGGVPYPKTREEILNEKAPAMLCAVLSYMSYEDYSDMLRLLNWKEAGVTKAEFVEWWDTHRRRDAERREREMQERAEKRARDDALAKLTPKERQVLGLKK